MLNEGKCSYGFRCFYAHSSEEIRENVGYPGRPPIHQPPPSLVNQPPPPSPIHGNSLDLRDVRSNIMKLGSDGKIKYKTRMCTVFMQQGNCPRGENCDYAHSEKQLFISRINRFSPMTTKLMLLPVLMGCTVTISLVVIGPVQV